MNNENAHLSVRSQADFRSSNDHNFCKWISNNASYFYSYYNGGGGGGGNKESLRCPTNIVHLLLNFRGGVHLIDSGEHGAQRHHRQEDDRELDAIGRQ
jgi:hypothetical protein